MLRTRLGLGLSGQGVSEVGLAVIGEEGEEGEEGGSHRKRGIGGLLV